MATSLLALLDDIASMLDDVAVFTKVATKKTAGVLGDDLALNAQQVAGVSSQRELPVVWAVARGSFRNKAILVPAALAISQFMPWAITPLLMAGGAFLCYEGFEKLAHRFLHHEAEDSRHRAELAHTLEDRSIDVKALEKEKIRGAVRTDFILSAEIITITLGTVAAATFGVKVGVLVGIALLMTIGVYGLVAGVVKLDDAGLYLLSRRGTDAFAGMLRWLGAAIVRAAPWLMKALSIAGTAAMFLVGGGILTHGIPGAHELIEHAVARIAAVPGLGTLAHALGPMLLDAIAGILAGAILLAVVGLVRRLWPRRGSRTEGNRGDAVAVKDEDRR